MKIMVNGMECDDLVHRTEKNTSKNITIYELLGLIKDGKAPKKIRVYGEISNDIFTFNKNAGVYYDDDCNTLGYKYNLEVMLDSEIEIIEEDKTHYTYKITKDENGTIVDAKGQRYSLIEEVEDKEYEDIDEAEYLEQGEYIDYASDYEVKFDIAKNRRLINALIRNQKKILERLDKE